MNDALADYATLSPAPDNVDAFLENIGNMWAAEPNCKKVEMAGITVPTLILDGWEEEAIYPAHDYEIGELIPGAELTLMPDVGQFAMFAAPEMFNSIVLNYLSR